MSPEDFTKYTKEQIEALNNFAKALEKPGTSLKVLMEAMYEVGKSFEVGTDLAKIMAITQKKLGYEQVDVAKSIANIIRNRIIEEEDLVERMSHTEREEYLKRLNATREFFKETLKIEDKLLDAYINENEFKLKTEELTAEKIIAAQEGIRARLAVMAKEIEMKFVHWAKNTFGVDSQMSKSMIKLGKIVSITALVIMGISAVFDTFSKKISNATNTLLMTGGYARQNILQISSTATYLEGVLYRASMAFLTSKEALEIYNQAVEAGLLSIARMTLAQKGITSTTADFQNKMIELTAEQAIKLQKLNVTIFGSNDRLSDMIKMMTYFRLTLDEETNNIFALLYEIGTEFGITATPLLDFMNVLGKTAFMTGINIYKSIGVIKQFGESLKKLSPEELKATYEALGRLVEQFDPLKYMAIMKGPEDIFEKYKKAIQDPLIGFIAYAQEVGKQLGVAPEKRGIALALALPELRQLGGTGVKIGEAIMAINLAQIKTPEALREALRREGLSEHLINLGEKMLMIKDPLARLLDYLMDFGGKLLPLIFIIAKEISRMVPGGRAYGKTIDELLRGLEIVTSQMPTTTINTSIKTFR